MENNMTERERLGSSLKTLRVLEGMTQIELAKKLGMETDMMVSMWENGRKAIPNKKLLKLCELLEISKESMIKSLLKIRKQELKSILGLTGKSKKLK